MDDDKFWKPKPGETATIRFLDPPQPELYQHYWRNGSRSPNNFNLRITRENGCYVCTVEEQRDRMQIEMFRINLLKAAATVI